MQDALLFGLLFWYLWQCVGPRLIYHGGGEIQVFPAFRWGSDYFHEIWPYEGGLNRYAAAFLAQSFYDGRLGALFLTVQAWVACAGTRLFLRALGADQLRWAGFVPPLLLLALHSGYTYCNGAVMNLLLGLGVACWYTRWRSTLPWARLAGIGIVAALLYALAGSAAGVFVALVMIFELCEGRWSLALLSLSLTIVLALAEGRILFGLNWGEALEGLRPFVWKVDTTVRLEMILVYALYLFLPVLSVGVLLWRGVASRSFAKRTSRVRVNKAVSVNKRAAPETGKGERQAKQPTSMPSSRWVLIIETACVLLAAAGVQALALDRNLRSVLAVDYYASRRMWPQVLSAARANPRNVYVVSAVNRALFHTGTLGRDLPLFQSADNLLLLEEDVRAHWNKIDIYLDLGCVNLALHHLAESVALYGERPYLLTRLALANLALGNIGTARIYLHSLARTPFYVDWASDYLMRIELDPTLAGDAEVTRLRGLMAVQDELVPLPAEQMLASLLDSHPTNRMAAEYLVCYDLLTKDLDALARALNLLDTLASGERPLLFDQAALLSARRKPPASTRIARAARAETQQQFQRFAELAKACKGKPLSSDVALSREW